MRESGLQARYSLVVMIALGLTTALVGQQKNSPKQAGHSGHDYTGAPASPADPKPRVSLPDLEVFDQNGRTRKSYTDLIKGRVVIINFVYTSCTAFCPMSGDNFSRLQTQLGERLGKDVYLMSVTTDPVTDTPDKLKTWGERFKARNGWTLVTGRKDSMTELLRVLTGDGPRTGYHVPGVVIVNDVRGNSRRVYGLEAPERLIKLTDELAQLPKG